MDDISKESLFERGKMESKNMCLFATSGCLVASVCFIASCSSLDRGISENEATANAAALVQMLHPATQIDRIYLQAAEDVKQAAAGFDVPDDVWDMVAVNIDGDAVTTSLVEAYRTAIADDDIRELVDFYQSTKGERIRKGLMFATLETEKVFTELRTQLAFQIAENVKKQIAESGKYNRVAGQPVAEDDSEDDKSLSPKKDKSLRGKSKKPAEMNAPVE